MYLLIIAFYRVVKYFNSIADYFWEQKEERHTPTTVYVFLCN